jgi:hypothetical protein
MDLVGQEQATDHHTTITAHTTTVSNHHCEHHTSKTITQSTLLMS